MKSCPKIWHTLLTKLSLHPVLWAHKGAVQQLRHSFNDLPRTPPFLFHLVSSHNHGALFGKGAILTFTFKFPWFKFYIEVWGTFVFYPLHHHFHRSSLAIPNPQCSFYAILPPFPPILMTSFMDSPWLLKSSNLLWSSSSLS